MRFLVSSQIIADLFGELPVISLNLFMSLSYLIPFLFHAIPIYPQFLIQHVSLVSPILAWFISCSYSVVVQSNSGQQLDNN
jgi:hypothetical protein